MYDISRTTIVTTTSQPVAFTTPLANSPSPHMINPRPLGLATHPARLVQWHQGSEMKPRPISTAAYPNGSGWAFGHRINSPLAWHVLRFNKTTT
jgi:hypothetical protein